MSYAAAIRQHHPDTFAKIRASDVTISEVKKEIKPIERDQSRQSLMAKASKYKDPAIEVVHLDFEQYAADNIQENSIDTIITDPPYEEKYLPLWVQIFKTAQLVLKPSGFCLHIPPHPHRI